MSHCINSSFLVLEQIIKHNLTASYTIYMYQNHRTVLYIYIDMEIETMR